MAYTALYRKWRPATFADVKGQDAIVTTLKNQIRMNRIGHAYLFCGTRGTGKTTVAKIFARAVNCADPQDGEPCGSCETCRGIEDGRSMNVVEIDAASNNGVDNIRQIRDEVQYSPTEGRYRVYIIDEAHMLSTGAFNALLKTLEEPPPYVIFILATTEPHKIPVTVLSRCQRYDFRRMTVDVMAERLRELAGYEQVQVEERALRYIAGKADGAMRDAISLLDQCISSHIGEDLTFERVLSVLGTVDNERFSHFLRGILGQNTSQCLDEIGELVMEGRELNQFVQDFIGYMRNLLILTTSEVGSDLLDLTREDWMRLREEAQMTNPAGLMRLIRIFSELYSEMRTAVNRRVLLEITVIRTAQPEMEENLESLEERVSRLERRVDEWEARPPAGTPSSPALPSEETPEEEEPEVLLPEAEAGDLDRICRDWETIQKSLDRMEQDAFAGTRLKPAGPGRLCVIFSDQMAYNMCKQLGLLEDVKETVEKSCGRTLEWDQRMAAGRRTAPQPPVTQRELEQVFVGVPVEVEDGESP